MAEKPNWHRFWRQYGPWLELATFGLMLLAALVIMVALLLNPARHEPPAALPSADPTEAPSQAALQTPEADPERVIYLTFDDGPGPHTARLLEILDKYDVKASFFVVETDDAGTIAQIAAAGHTLGMHSATHDFARVYASEEAYFEDLERIRSVIEVHSGQSPRILRFPGGSSNTVSKEYNEGLMTRLTAKVEEMGYTYFDWNVDADDAGKADTSQAVYQNVTRGCQAHEVSVVLMHDIHEHTVDAVGAIIVWGLIHGYRFEALTEDSPTCHHTVNN